jgi:hypothetical protein
MLQTLFNLETIPKAKPRWAGRREDNIPEKFHPRELTYISLAEHNENMAKTVESVIGKRLPTEWPKEPNVVSNFACRSAEKPGSSKKIASEVIRTGGIPDIKELSCSLNFGNKKELDVTVRFSEISGFVQGNHDRWMTGAFVNDKTIGFNTTNSETRISRTTGKISVTDKNDSLVLATGNCEVAGSSPAKF